MGDLLIAAGFLALLLVYLAYWVISHAIRALYGLLPWVARRRREARQRWLEELAKQQQEREREERERQRREEARRRAVEDAKRQFEEAALGGRFPSDEVLAILADCDSDIPTNVKEGLEELLFGRCSFKSIMYCDAVRLIQQRQRIDGRARKRRADGFETTGPVTPTEACELLGVAPGCSPEELAAAYRRTIGQWHPDRLNEAMAQELREYATRRTQRINEAFQLLRERA